MPPIPPRRDDHRRSGQGEVADDVAVGRMSARLGGGGQHGPADTGHGPAVDDEVVHPMTEREGQQTVAFGLDRLAHERFHDAGPVPHVTWKRGTELPCPPA